MSATKRALSFAFVTLLGLTMLSCSNKTDHKSTWSATPARIPMNTGGKLQISEEDRCPVCAMMPAKNPKFFCGIGLDDGRTYHFCGTGCLMRSWLHAEEFLGVPKSKLRRATVREYMGGEQVDAMSAFWVAGSDVVGPMGKALVPLKNSADLEAFQQRHGGAHVFKLGELDDAKWFEITGKHASKKH